MPILQAYQFPDMWIGDDDQRRLVTSVITEQIVRIINYECCEPGDVGGIETDQCPVCMSGGCSCQEDDCEMANCYIPVGSLRWDDGVLQYLTCQGWIDVEGDTAQVVPVIPPDIDTDQTTVYPCGKATILAETIVKLIDELWDESDNQLPKFLEWYLENYMSLELKGAWILQAQTQALLMKGIVVGSAGALNISKSEVLPSGVTDDLVCKVLPYMSDTAEDDKETIWSGLQRAVDLLFPPAGLVDDIFINLFWKYSLSAFGKQLLHDIAQSGAYDDTALCDCTGGVVTPPEEYTGTVYFEGPEDIQLESNGASIYYRAQLGANHLRITVRGGLNSNYQEVVARERLAAYGTISELEVQIRPNPNGPISTIPDYFPADNWDDTNPTALSNYTTPVIGGVTAPDSTTYTPSYNQQTMVFKWDTPINLDAAYIEWGAKLNPKDQSASAQEYKNDWYITYAGQSR